jgi:CDP-glycerol glycerophosphotransferase (TagB/SpsB family)
MKIDKGNPSHWASLSLFGRNVVCAMGLRPFRRRRPKRQVVLYGHKLAGNLLAIYRHLKASAADIDVVFLTMDKGYHRELSASGVCSILATSPACLGLLRRVDAVISDHGLHVMSPMLSLTDVKFFDVWHGIPFKGFDARDFRVQHRYDEVWVASPLLARLYVERYGFDAAKVKVTGYARTDRLVRRDEDTVAIKRRLGLDGSDVGKIVLFAPTWKQDANGRSIYPFGLSEQAFLGSLSTFAQSVEATFVIRAHLNTGSGANDAWPRIEYRSHARFPDTEELLLISDILVCDWSSIAFDYLLLNRPTIFLDVAAPFAKGFSLGPEYRFGPVVSDIDTLLQMLECYVLQPPKYLLDFGERAEEVRRAVYNEFANGEAARSCVERLRNGLKTIPD